MKKLWRIVEQEKIRVEYEDMSNIPEKPHGLYMYSVKCGPVIVLDTNILSSPRLMKCVFAEEVGHYFTAPRTNMLVAYTSTSQRIIQSQDERKAMKWATDFYMPTEALLKAIKSGCSSHYELSEWFDVTEWFVYRKLELVKLRRKEV